MEEVLEKVSRNKAMQILGLVVETIVFSILSALFCPVLPQSAKVCIIIKLECRGR